jgi:fibro-slime domain-containing protein
LKKKKELLSAFNKASTAIVLIVMIVVSSFSAIAVSSDVFQSGRESSDSSTGAEVSTDLTGANTDYTAGNAFSSDADNVIPVEATYFDYLSDNEVENGWLNTTKIGTFDSYDNWYPFYWFNKAISDDAGSWSNPLYFGNFCNTGRAYYTSSHYPNYGGFSGFDNAVTNNGLVNWNYVINNSNGLAGYHSAVRGLADSSLNSDNMITSNGKTMPYFDTTWLSQKHNNKTIAKTIKSYFPFRKSTKSASNGTEVTTYNFESGTDKNKNSDTNTATDNVYFTWNSDGTPRNVHYGSGNAYGVKDGLTNFMGSSYASGYGIFPFNNGKSSTASNRPSSSQELDFGFGIRLDMDFKVPEDGLLADNEHVKFNYSGDDDLWVYITDKETNESQLVLDLGGNHKMAEGSIDFATMQSTTRFASEKKSGSSVKDSVMSFYDKTGANASNKDDNKWDAIYIYAWDKNNGDKHAWFQAGYDEASGRYYVTKDQLGLKSDSSETATYNGVDLKLSDMTNFKLCDTMSFDTARKTDWNGFEGYSFAWGNGFDLKKDTNNNNFYLDSSYSYTFDHDIYYYDSNIVDDFGFETKSGRSLGTYENLDPSKTYHMTVFYMERGTIESNFKVSFTMTPATNDLKVNKTVNTTNVNTGLVDAVKNKEFTFTPKENGNTATTKYTLNSATSLSTASPSFVLKSGDTADFDDQFTTGSTMKVEESTSTTGMQCDTTWEVIDNQTNKVIKDTSGNEAKGTGTSTTGFKLVNTTDENNYAELQANFVNTPKVKPLTLSKKVVDDSGNADTDDDTEFTYKVGIDLDGGTNYTYYNLAYTLKNSDGTTTNKTATNGAITFKQSQTVEIQGVPVGATYKVAETTTAGYTIYGFDIGSGESTFTTDDKTLVGLISESGSNTVKFINKQSPAEAKLVAKKTLDTTDYSGSAFTFDAVELTTDPNSGALVKGEINSSGTSNSSNSNYACEVSNVKNGQVVFGATEDNSNSPALDTNENVKSIKYESAGDYLYMITEKSISDNDYQTDSSIIFAKVTVSSDSTTGELKAEAPVYIEMTAEKFNELENSGSNVYLGILSAFNNGATTSSKTFNNYQSLGEVTVIKTDKLVANQDGTASPAKDASLISGAVFTLYYVDDGNLTAVTDSTGNAVTQTSDENGEVKFSGLAIFAKDSTGKYLDGNNGADKKYQDYCVKETQAPEGYALSEASYTFNFSGKTYSQYTDTSGKSTKVEINGLLYDGIYVTSSAVVNAPITVPYAGEFEASNIFFAVGGGIMALAVVFAGVYFFNTRRRKANVSCRHGR